MNLKKLFVLLVCITLMTPIYTKKVQASNNTACTYKYTFNVHVSNAVTKKNFNNQKINTLYFNFSYLTLNGYGHQSVSKYDMSKSGNTNNHYDFIKEHFVSDSSKEYDTSFDLTLEGKLTKMSIKLNMDDGDNLTFKVNSITCNGKKINSNTGSVSSSYNDSSATINCSMEDSKMDRSLSPFYDEDDHKNVTEKEIKKIANIYYKNYANQFKDQYDAYIDTDVLSKTIPVSDGDINQYFSHSDEKSMYKYRVYVNVSNPINLKDASKDEVETFYMEFEYKNENGYGDSKTYKLDLAYNKSKKRNLNQKYLNYFERNNDNSYNTSFDVWVPGIVNKLKFKINMSGEKLSINFNKVTLRKMQINTSRNSVSSVYFDSSDSIDCKVSRALIVGNKESLISDKSLKDQYNGLVSDKLLSLAKKNPKKYLYYLKS